MATPFVVERTAVVPAPPAAVYPLLVDFHRWTAWSPWEDIDPAMQRTYAGAEAGVGASYAWKGNRKAGAGSMEITDVTPDQRVQVRLRFLKPFPADNQIVFDLTPQGAGTRVLWRMTGESSGLGGLMARFGLMDKLVGKDFEKGLSRLAAAAAAS